MTSNFPLTAVPTYNPSAIPASAPTVPATYLAYITSALPSSLHAYTALDPAGNCPLAPFTSALADIHTNDCVYYAASPPVARLACMCTSHFPDMIAEITAAAGPRLCGSGVLADLAIASATQAISDVCAWDSTAAAARVTSSAYTYSSADYGYSSASPSFTYGPGTSRYVTSTSMSEIPSSSASSSTGGTRYYGNNPDNTYGNGYDNGGSSGLHGGAWAGIVIAIIAFLLLVGIVIFRLVKRKQRRRGVIPPSDVGRDEATIAGNRAPAFVPVISEKPKGMARYA